LAAALAAGRCGIGPLTTVPTDRLTVKIAAEIADFDPAAQFDRKQLLMLDRATQFALVAARQALAGIDLAALDPARCGAVLGAAIGQTTLDAAYHALYAEGATRLPPLTVPRGMPSAAASHIAMAHGLQGPCFATASACASAAHAIGIAFHMIRAGTLDLAVTGGADASLCVGYLKAWDALRVLSPDGCRPFSADRNGLVLGEGAGLLVLEAWDHARRRGAPIHAELLGFGMGADAGDLIAPSADGAARAMRAALADAGLAPEAIGYVNAHGTATRLNDRTETTALRDVFGAHLARLPVSSSKSLHGHCLNAAGGIEALVTVLALCHGVLPPTLGYTTPDPDCDLDCIPHAARHVLAEAALSNSFAFGGLNAVLAFGAAA
jgi:nodulation protein E